MVEGYSLSADGSNSDGRGQAPQIVIQNLPPKQPWLGKTFTRFLLFASIVANISLFGLYQTYFPKVTSNERFKEGKQFATAKIAVVRVSGVITSESIVAPKKELKSAAEDEEVKAVVLVVESPGGTIAGSDELYHVIEEFKQKKKPLVVSMQGMATSGGYYIAVPADKIYADRSCVTGSIGVIAGLPNVEKLMKDFGVQYVVVKSGEMKDSGSPFRAMTDKEKAEWQKLINEMYGQFLGVVLKYRKDKVGGEPKLRQLADGRVFLAPEAKSLGLIDEIGYETDAINSAKQLANLGDDYKVVTYSRPPSYLEFLEGKAPASGAFPFTKWLELHTPRFLLMPGSMIDLSK